ncbi:hypothetical protein, partial [Acetobacter syzygii]|uniref:hypothetical protein n=1 Tax=Acetobacter syzygii TaxID=146476 RepID=UPI0039E8E7B8
GRADSTSSKTPLWESGKNYLGGSRADLGNNNKFIKKQLYFMLLYRRTVVKNLPVLTLRAGLRRKKA